MSHAVNRKPPADAIVSTTPSVRISYLVSFLAAVLLPAIALPHAAEMTGKTAVIVSVLWVVMLAGFAWSAGKYRRLETKGDGLILIRGLPPLRRTMEIPFGVIRRSFITDYSHQLVLKLEDGSQVVVANYYSVPCSKLPAVELAPYEPGGVYKTLKALKALIDAGLEDHPLAP